MTKNEIRELAEEMVEELRELPDGTEITSGQILKTSGIEPDELDDRDLFGFHEALFRAAKANHITLDMAKHDGLVEGLPWNLDFVVRNKKAQIKCPHCGSRNTGRIVYGLPAFSEELQKKLDAGRLRLGGCCISHVHGKNGEMIGLDPQCFCNDCEKEFGMPPYLVSKEKTSAEAYADIVTEVSFSDGGFFQGFSKLSIRKTPEEKTLLEVCPPHTLPEESMHYELSINEWKRLIEHLYCKLFLDEWKHSYDDPDVQDGEQWTLEIKCTNDRTMEYYGSNAFPPYWRELRTVFRPYFKKAGIRR